MKNTIKLIGIIALVAVIGFAMAACSNGSTSSTSGVETLRSTTYSGKAGSEDIEIIIAEKESDARNVAKGYYYTVKLNSTIIDQGTITDSSATEIIFKSNADNSSFTLNLTINTTDTPKMTITGDIPNNSGSKITGSAIAITSTANPDLQGTWWREKSSGGVEEIVIKGAKGEDYQIENNQRTHGITFDVIFDGNKTFWFVTTWSADTSKAPIGEKLPCEVAPDKRSFTMGEGSDKTTLTKR